MHWHFNTNTFQMSSERVRNAFMMFACLWASLYMYVCIGDLFLANSGLTHSATCTMLLLSFAGYRFDLCILKFIEFYLWNLQGACKSFLNSHDHQVSTWQDQHKNEGKEEGRRKNCGGYTWLCSAACCGWEHSTAHPAESTVSSEWYSHTGTVSGNEYSLQCTSRRHYGILVPVKTTCSFGLRWHSGKT